MNSAETCRANGWTVGTRLIGTEHGGHTDIVEITAIGERSVLAKVLACNKNADTVGWESTWTFDCRDWQITTEEVIDDATR